jgi:hypothetical protein
MRVSGIVPLVLLAACSESSGTSNNVDVAAAASRAENDIANYGAARREGRDRKASATTTVAAPTLREDRGAGGRPTAAK